MACTDRVPPLAPRPPHAFGVAPCEGACLPTCSDPTSTADGGRDAACADSTATPFTPLDTVRPQLRITAAQGPNPERSFTTRASERTLTLRASVRPAALEGTVRWQVVADPTNGVAATAPTNAPPNGSASAVDLPAQTTARWRLPHGTAWTRKALAYRAIAEAPNVFSGAPMRDSMLVQQREVDVLRQEYLDFGIPAPAASDTRTAGDVAGQTRFTWAQLNQGDYAVAVLTPVLLARLDQIDASADRTLVLTSVFRNPAHHRFHIRVSGGGATALLSQHQYGTAVDIRTFGAPVLWGRIRNLAKQGGACAEPLKISTADHVHADWRTGAPVCPTGW